MTDVIVFLAPAGLTCIILTGIHCYLGLHVLTRNVVFVDLALAQAAGFGLAVSFLLGCEPGSLKSYLTVLSGALTAGGLFTLMDSYKKIPREAFIGIVYAFFSALVILLFDRAAHGAERIKQTLTGHLIYVTYSDVLKIFLIYTAVSTVCFLFHKSLWRASLGQTSKWKWNMLFYTLFSVIIAGSVSTAGVLLVFAFLIVPAFLSGFLFKNFFHRLIFGWMAGAFLTLAGLTASYAFDLPTSPFLVFLFTLVPVVFILAGVFKKNKREQISSTDLI